MGRIIKFDSRQALGARSLPVVLDQLTTALSPLDLSLHVLSFLAPAAAVALLVTLAARVILPAAGRPGRWWLPLAVNFLAGVLVLGAGLAVFGRDGKMATYAALVLAVATVQWLGGRAWRA
jgi:hypothetical protein